MMKSLKYLLLTVAVLAAATLPAREYRVAAGDVAATLREAKPGDRIVIEDGVYNDLTLKWLGRGSEKKAPAHRGSDARRGGLHGHPRRCVWRGEWVEVSGLCFRDGHAPSGSVIEFRNGREVANHCRLTECVVDGYNPARRDMAYSYILLYGRHNRVDHCTLTGKLNLGVTLIVMLNEERSQQNFPPHRPQLVRSASGLRFERRRDDPCRHLAAGLLVVQYAH